ncbi:MAG TPA: chemotaxis protein CheC [Myxococcaceae bacterium]|nr:chemotaxis protein CheC [Myxococcaceae bacterium]
MNPLLPTDSQLDALREVANIGVGQAASALSRMVGGRRVDIGVPRAMVVERAELMQLLGGEGTQVVSASLGVVGDLSGQLLLVLMERDAVRLGAVLLGKPGTAEGPLGEDHRSAFAETANILASACLSAIGKLTNFKLLPSVPTLAEDSAGAVMDRALTQLDSGPPGKAVVLECRFTTAGSVPIEGQLLVIPHLESLKRLLERLGV